MLQQMDLEGTQLRVLLAQGDGKSHQGLTDGAGGEENTKGEGKC